LAHLVVIASAVAQPVKTARLDRHGDALPDGAVARLGSVCFEVPADFGVHAFSPDGATVALATHDREKGLRVYYLDTATGKSVHKFDLADFPDFGETGWIHFSPDGKTLVFQMHPGLRLVDATTGKVAGKLELDKVSDSKICFSPDGERLAAQPREYAHDAPVKVWETKTGKELASLPGRGALCQDIKFSPDGKRLLIRSIVPTKVEGSSLAFDWPNCKTALACIDIDKRKIIGEMDVGASQNVALCDDGETVAFEAEDQKSVHVRHLASGADRCAIDVKHSQIAFAPGGKTLLTIDEEGRAALWDTAKGTKVLDLEGALVNKDHRILGISKDGRKIVVLDGGWHESGTVVVWNAGTGKRVGRQPGHDGAVTCLAFVPGGKLLASGSADKTVRLWNPATGEHLRILTTHDEAIKTIAISADGKLLASSTQSGVVRVSNVADGKTVAELHSSAEGAGTLTFSQDGKMLFAGGASPEILGWEIGTGKEVVGLKTGDDDGAVKALADGGALGLTTKGKIDTYQDDILRVWSLTKRLPVASVDIAEKKDDDRHHGEKCSGATFAPGGRMLAVSQITEFWAIRTNYGNPQLRLWEPTSGQLIRALSTSVTHLLAFSPTGRLLASGGANESGGGKMWIHYGSGVDIWDTITGKKLRTLSVTPSCVGFNPDGVYLATGGPENNLLIWEVPKLQPPDKTTAPTENERDAWWTALGGDAKDAYKIIEQMIDVPEAAVELLKKRVRPVELCDAKAAAKWIAKLDSDSFDERKQAHDALQEMGEGAAHLLKKALDDKPSLEMQKRLEELLSKCEETTTRSRQQFRAVATLEWIGTPVACELLRALAAGAPAARVTNDARAALKRLEE
jgi:WD40 repeat protein